MTPELSRLRKLVGCPASLEDAELRLGPADELIEETTMRSNYLALRASGITPEAPEVRRQAEYRTLSPDYIVVLAERDDGIVDIIYRPR